MEPANGESFVAYDQEQLDSVLDRMAARAAGLLGGTVDPILLGIQRRGEPLADLIQRRLAARHNLHVPRFSLKLKRYADNLALVHPDTQLIENVEFAERDLTHATVLIVDDVLYQGYSLLRVLTYLGARAPKAIHAAVLVDRCVAQFPVRASIVGIRLQLAANEIVECHVPPYEKDFAVCILRRAAEI